MAHTPMASATPPQHHRISDATSASSDQRRHLSIIASATPLLYQRADHALATAPCEALASDGPLCHDH
jgi:hypothetical protein